MTRTTLLSTFTALAITLFGCTGPQERASSAMPARDPKTTETSPQISTMTQTQKNVVQPCTLDLARQHDPEAITRLETEAQNSEITARQYEVVERTKLASVLEHNGKTLEGVPTLPTIILNGRENIYIHHFYAVTPQQTSAGCELVLNVRWTEEVLPTTAVFDGTWGQAITIGQVYYEYFQNKTVDDRLKPLLALSFLKGADPALNDRLNRLAGAAANNETAVRKVGDLLVASRITMGKDAVAKMKVDIQTLWESSGTRWKVLQKDWQNVQDNGSWQYENVDTLDANAADAFFLRRANFNPDLVVLYRVYLTRMAHVVGMPIAVEWARLVESELLTTNLASRRYYTQTLNAIR